MYIEEEPVPQGTPLNSVVDQVKTEWVAFVDDDEVDPHYVEWLAQEAQDNDAVVFRMQFMRDVWSIRKWQIIPRPEDSTLRHGNVGISFAMKTALLKANPFIREGVNPGSGPSEDWHMIDTLIKQGRKIKVSDRVAYYVRAGS